MRKTCLPRLMLPSFLVSFFLVSCTRGAVLLTTPVPSATSLPTEATELPTLLPTQVEELMPTGVEYGAVWIPQGEYLNIRQPAGIAGMIVDRLPPNARGIYLTGNQSMLGSSEWVEVILADGKLGWVNFWNLSEYFSPRDFCGDVRVRQLIEDFKDRMVKTETEGLSEMISPRHGLTLRLNWYSLDVRFSREEIETALYDGEVIYWGEMADSGLSVDGTFDQVIRPKIMDVFAQAPVETCNQLQHGTTSGDVIWPREFSNINYYSFYRPAEQGGNEFDWRTWGVGIEYLQGVPSIAILIQYSSEF